jgi:Ni2+-binding GTPase involved in maturation of urease and hydrogenase
MALRRVVLIGSPGGGKTAVLAVTKASVVDRCDFILQALQPC